MQINNKPLSGNDIITGLAVAVLWGLNFIAIKMGLREIPPFLLGALRFAAVILPAIFFIPRPPVAWHLLIGLGLTINVGQFAFLFLGMKLGMPAMSSCAGLLRGIHPCPFWPWWYGPLPWQCCRWLCCLG